MDIKKLQEVLHSRFLYELKNEKVTSGMIEYSFVRTEGKTKYTLDFSSMVDGYLFMYRDSTGGCCSYNSLVEVIMHLVSVHDGIEFNSELSRDKVSSILDELKTPSVTESLSDAVNLSGKLDTKKKIK